MPFSNYKVFAKLLSSVPPRDSPTLPAARAPRPKEDVQDSIFGHATGYGYGYSVTGRGYVGSYDGGWSDYLCKYSTQSSMLSGNSDLIVMGGLDSQEGGTIGTGIDELATISPNQSSAQQAPIETLAFAVLV
jgi:hypothetical protein